MEPVMKKKKASALRQQKKLKPSPVDFTETSVPPALDVWVDKQALIGEFKISEKTLYNLRKKKKLPFARLGRLILYNRTKLEEKFRRSSGLIILIIQLIFYALPEMNFAVDI